MQTINLYLHKKSIIPVLHAKQGDVGRKFQVAFADGIPDGVTFSVWYSGASGEGNYTAVGDRSAFSVDGNNVTVELITQMLTNAGKGKLCLVMSGADGSQWGSWNIPYEVEPVPGMDSDVAEQYFTAFAEVIKNLPYPDVSLTAAGKAADAAAVGAALKNKAPAGYGLGGDASTARWANVDNIVANGWYLFSAEDIELPTLTVTQAIMHVDAFNSGFAIQTISPLTVMPMLKLVRQLTPEGWTPWEWENPPMLLGVEYRTTERFMGQPVYRKIVSLGDLGGDHSFEMDTQLGIFDASKCIEVLLIDGDGLNITHHAAVSHLAADGSSISVETTGACSDVTAYLRYTKNETSE